MSAHNNLSSAGWSALCRSGPRLKTYEGRDVTTAFRNWQAVQQEVLRRIHAREWAPGDLIPNEADLAADFGCARATVNRALRAVAEAGLLDRRRKAGTRVALQPVARATLSIAVIRQEVEEKGARYGYALLERSMMRPPAPVRAALNTSDAVLLHIRAMHFADCLPYALEDRWINPAGASGVLDQPFDTTSANEWLLEHTPYTGGDIALSAHSATQPEAQELRCTQGAALFALTRNTWNGTTAVTRVRLLFAPGHTMQADL